MAAKAIRHDNKTKPMTFHQIKNAKAYLETQQQNKTNKKKHLRMLFFFFFTNFFIQILYDLISDILSTLHGINMSRYD